MKTFTMTTIAVLTILACVPTAPAADNATSNYLGAVVYVPASYTNAGDTGMTVSNAYLAIPSDALGITTGNVGDVRQVMYSIAQMYHTSWTASTNPSESTPGRLARYAESGSNVVETVTHTLRTQRIATSFELE